VHAAYNRTIEDLLGRSSLQKLQKGILNVIKKGKFSNFVRNQLSCDHPFDDSNINYNVPIPSDVDPINREKRKVKYEKSR